MQTTLEAPTPATELNEDELIAAYSQVLVPYGYTRTLDYDYPRNGFKRYACDNESKYFWLSCLSFIYMLCLKAFVILTISPVFQLPVISLWFLT